MRLRITSAVLLAVLLGGVSSVGCGKKKAPSSDGEVAEAPPPVMPVTPVPVRPPVTTPAGVLPFPDSLPALPAPTLPPVVVPTPLAGQPPQGEQPPPPKGELPPPSIPPPTTIPPPPPGTLAGQPTSTSPSKEPGKFEWPKEVHGRDVMAYLKDCTDADPAMRETGLRTLPTFGPSVKKLADKDGKNLFGRAVISRMDFDKEKDTGVRTAAYATAAVMGFEDDADTKEAVRHLCIAIDKGISGGSGRQHAVQALAAFGTKAESAVTVLVGAPVTDVAYETRRSVAFTLGKISLNESTGPNAKALTCLTAQLAADPSAVVRLEALQSLAVLGPPWEGIHTGGDKVPPKLDLKGIAAHVGVLKRRLAPAPAGKGEKSSTGLIEKDKQVELWVRFVLMRFDTKEINDDNLNAIAKAVSHPEQGPRIQALAIISMMGEAGARRIDDVVKALGSDDILVVQTAINTLGTLGVNSKPAVPELKKLATHKDETVKKLAAEAVKFITEAKTPGEAMKKP